jgi:hypothetical protein
MSTSLTVFYPLEEKEEMFDETFAVNVQRVIMIVLFIFFVYIYKFHHD